MSPESFLQHRSEFVIRPAVRFLGQHALAVVLISALLVIPCFWHTHIQAGDLGSHVYNAWLAQLIEHHQVTGLVIVRQWSNVLFDLLLLGVGNLIGLVGAEKVVVSFAVLIFFWGSFSFVSVISGRVNWLLTPLLFPLSYGYVFHMGFFNFYLSVGFAFFAISVAPGGGAGNWLLAAPLALLSLFAHPIGFLLAVSVTIYIQVWRALPIWWRWVAPTVVMIFLGLLRFYFASHQALEADWRSSGFFQLLGQDQLNLFGHRYFVLSCFALAWGILSVAASVYDWLFRAKSATPALGLCCELYLVAIVATFCLPENLRTSIYAGWVGLLVSRLTLVTAIFGLGVLATLRLPRWSVHGFAMIGVLFFVFVRQDTGKLDRMEAGARAAIQTLPPGTRIVAVANPPDDWRIDFIHHSIERACVGRCFSYGNYEPSSLQFRVRALPGSWVVTDSVDKSESMSSGDYIVQNSDLPLTSIYPCDESDFTVLCALPLREGRKTEDPEADPDEVPPPDSSSKN
jgi:hypothetical protein